MSDLLTESEKQNDGSIELPDNGVTGAVGEVKRKRGRPPGSKNRPREEKDGSLAIGLENSIKGLFELITIFAGWFGYEKIADLTDEEAAKGGKAFAPIAAKIPWFARIAMYIGAPVWLVMTLRNKFRSKREIANRPNNPGNSNVASLPVARVEGSETPAYPG